MNITKLKLIRVKREENKLRFVKLIKDLTGLGLRESKDLSDSIDTMFNSKLKAELVLEVSPKLTKVEVDSIIEELHKTGYITIFNDRNIRLLTLGIGEKDEYVENLYDMLLSNTEKSKIMLKEILGRLSEDEIKKIFNELYNELYGNNK